MFDDFPDPPPPLFGANPSICVIGPLDRYYVATVGGEEVTIPIPDGCGDDIPVWSLGRKWFGTMTIKMVGDQRHLKSVAMFTN